MDHGLHWRDRLGTGLVQVDIVGLGTGLDDGNGVSGLLSGGGAGVRRRPTASEGAERDGHGEPDDDCGPRTKAV
jgi:hypothetical protein